MQEKPKMIGNCFDNTMRNIKNKLSANGKEV
jgi:hypothetical protein